MNKIRIPRFIDSGTGIPYEVVLFCQACGWAIPKDKMTKGWSGCRVCRAKLITKRIDYPSERTE